MRSPEQTIHGYACVHAWHNQSVNWRVDLRQLVRPVLRAWLPGAGTSPVLKQTMRVPAGHHLPAKL